MVVGRYVGVFYGGGGVLRSHAPGCASRPREGGRAGERGRHHHARPLAARWRGRNERGERERNEPMGHFRRDFSKGLLEGTSRRDFPKDFSKGLFEGTIKVCNLFKAKGLRFEK
eukprot:scaffold4523_cov63-Phaeocystis_antarctica.AAC.3